LGRHSLAISWLYSDHPQQRTGCPPAMLRNGAPGRHSVRTEKRSDARHGRANSRPPQHHRCRQQPLHDSLPHETGQPPRWDRYRVDRYRVVILASHARNPRVPMGSDTPCDEYLRLRRTFRAALPGREGSHTLGDPAPDSQSSVAIRRAPTVAGHMILCLRPCTSLSCWPSFRRRISSARDVALCWDTARQKVR